jgi:class 3 adenylate cyclase
MHKPAGGTPTLPEKNLVATLTRRLPFTACSMSEKPLSARSKPARFFSLRAKIVLAMAVVAALVASAIVATNTHLRRAQLLDEFQQFVRGVAGTTALALSGDGIATIRTDSDANSAAFQNARRILDYSRRINGLTEQELYILRPINIGNNTDGDGLFETEFVVMLQRKTFIGSRYTIPESNRPQFRAAWSDGQPASTGIYRDANGTWISGYAPVFNKAGKPVAIIEADAEISRFIAKQREELWLAAVVACGAFVVAMLPGLFLAANITRGLHKLARGMRRFKNGDHDVQVTLRTRDEIEDLGSVFNDMIRSLGEKLALLPYVSRFTAEAVRRSREDPNWLMGSEQEVMVLFADLRGFTTWCETREARELVRELNRLLAVQADVVVSAGGDVDKFIGDSVMAVFLDEEDTPQKVFDCAKALIARVHEETLAQGWPLALGVGIHYGHAVVGSIGSDTRRDFTAIGHTVNFASRLCDKAGAWQVLVSEAFHKLLPNETRQRFERTEPMQFKNVSQFMPTYRFVSEQSARSAEVAATR